MATYYMDPAGNDGAAGSEGAPWKTFKESLPKLIAGDTLNVGTGTYLGSNETNHAKSAADGNAANRITVTSYNGQVDWDGEEYDANRVWLYHDYWTIRGIRRFGFEAGFSVRGNYVIIEDCWFYNLFNEVAEPAESSTVGIYANTAPAGTCTGLIIRNNTFSNIPAGVNWDPKGEAIYIDANNMLVTDFEIYGNDISDGCDGIDIKNDSGPFVVRDNYIHDMQGGGESPGWGIIQYGVVAGGGRGLIERNFLDACHGGLRVSADCDVWNNVIVNGNGSGQFRNGVLIWGEVTAGWGDNNTVYNNTMANNDYYGIWFQTPAETRTNTVKNNICSGNGTAQIWPKDDAGFGGANDNVFDYNLLYGLHDQYVYLAGTNGLYDVNNDGTGPQPEFAAVDAKDFRLSKKSPCIDAGIGLADITVDHDGKARKSGKTDIGAYEYVPIRPRHSRTVMGKGSVGGSAIVR